MRVLYYLFYKMFGSRRYTGLASPVTSRPLWVVGLFTVDFDADGVESYLDSLEAA
jgi:hypothetical protein